MVRRVPVCSLFHRLIKRTCAFFACSLTLVCFSIFFFSCSSKHTKASFLAKLDEADMFIEYSQFSNAEKTLRAAFKIAQNDIQYVSVYKRFYTMNKMDACEKVIKKAYRKYFYKPEIQALYAHFLLETKQYKKALPVAKKLIDTDYASLYSEALFITTTEKEDFFSSEYIRAYIAAYNQSGNSMYSLNAASLLAGLGRFHEAMLFHPAQITRYEPAYFWALIAYDAGDFDTCIYNLSLLPFSEKHIVLQADAYLKAGLLDEAGESWLLAISHEVDSPISYLNAAHASEEKGKYYEASQWLLKMVNLYPHFAPGLIEYGYYTLRLEKLKKDDVLSADLELKGVKTLQNLKLEEFIQIPVSDALWRIENSLKEKDNIDLELEKIKLSWAADPERSRAQKNSEVYALLEKHYLGDSLYTESVIQWALWYFLNQRQWKEAEELFYPYLRKKYGEYSKGSNDGVHIVFDPYNKIAEMLSWEREYLAYLAAMTNDDLHLAYTLLSYEYEYGQAVPMGEGAMFKKRDRLPLLMNLANMYFGLSQTEKAIELYSLASSLALSDKLKSDIHYRLALINVHKKETKNALLNAEYSVLLNPDNTEARLLYKKLKE